MVEGFSEPASDAVRRIEQPDATPAENRAAKWAAVIVLGGSSMVGMAWSIVRAEQRAARERPADAAALGGGAAEQDRAAPVSVDRPLLEPARLGRTPDVPAVGEPGAAEPGEAGSVTTRIDLNTASAAELELLPGIGVELADRIVQDREANGPFAAVEDLDRVPGIGPRTIAALRDLVTAGGG